MKVLVIGATGCQGGAVVTKLLENKHQVRAFVRDPNSNASEELKSRGVELAVGDLNDYESLLVASHGVDGVFSIQQAALTDDSEIKQAENIGRAAKETGVQHIVHTSVVHAGKHETFPGWNEGRWEKTYWINKFGAEEAVRNSGVKYWTILQPSFFYENFISPRVAVMAPTLSKCLFKTVVKPHSKITLIGSSDIGQFAVAAFENPENYHGQSVDLGNEWLTYPEIAEVFTKTLGRKFEYEYQDPEEAIRNGAWPAIIRGAQFANEYEYKDTSGKLKSYGLPLQSLEQFIKKNESKFAFEN